MQIVIDIDEDDFKIIKHNVEVNHPLCPLSEEVVVTKIANGTPLPKGHGRLIDADALIKNETEQVCKYCDRRKNGKKQFVYEIGEAPCRACAIGDMLDFIEEAPTIIEAESEEKE